MHFYYEQDDGSLTDEQIDKIKELSSATGISEDQYEKTIFDLMENSND